MSVIRCIYAQDPGFPATDQHPDAVRYEINGYFVDAIEGEPTLGEVMLLVNPPPTRDELDAAEAKQYANLVALRGMSPAQVVSWVQNNITDFQDAKGALTTLAIAVSILARRL